jgi:hypothetical protein
MPVRPKPIWPKSHLAESPFSRNSFGRIDPTGRKIAENFTKINWTKQKFDFFTKITLKLHFTVPFAEVKDNIIYIVKISPTTDIRDPIKKNFHYIIHGIFRTFSQKMQNVSFCSEYDVWLKAYSLGWNLSHSKQYKIGRKWQSGPKWARATEKKSDSDFLILDSRFRCISKILTVQFPMHRQKALLTLTAETYRMNLFLLLSIPSLFEHLAKSIDLLKSCLCSR